MSYLRSNITLALLLLLLACDSKKATTTIAEKTLLLPTKDDVALVDGTPYSISGFLAIKNYLSDLSADQVVWMGIAALTLQNDAMARNSTLTAPAALGVARYAVDHLSKETTLLLLQKENSLGYFKPSGSIGSVKEVKTLIEDLMSRAVINRNAQVIAELSK